MFETILKQLRAWQRAIWALNTRLVKDNLIHKKYRHKSDDKKEWYMKGDKWSLEFILDQSIKMR